MNVEVVGFATSIWIFGVWTSMMFVTRLTPRFWRLSITWPLWVPLWILLKGVPTLAYGLARQIAPTAKDMASVLYGRTYE